VERTDKHGLFVVRELALQWPVFSSWATRQSSAVKAFCGSMSARPRTRCCPLLLAACAGPSDHNELQQLFHHLQ
jgi:hypothetical protein